MFPQRASAPTVLSDQGKAQAMGSRPNPQPLISLGTTQREVRDLSPNVSIPKRLNGVLLPLFLSQSRSLVMPVNSFSTPCHDPKSLCFMARAECSILMSKVLRLS